MQKRKNMKKRERPEEAFQRNKDEKGRQMEENEMKVSIRQGNRQQTNEMKMSEISLPLRQVALFSIFYIIANPVPGHEYSHANNLSEFYSQSPVPSSACSILN